MTSPKVAIVDHSLGNLQSVRQACLHVGLDCEITSSGADLSAAEAVILPGVGAFGDAMKTLKERDLIGPLKEVAESGKVLLGVCLGMQLLMESSEEFRDQRGLGLVEGHTLRFSPVSLDNRKVKVPQIGWNRIRRPEPRRWDGTPLQSLDDGAFMYFLHSYLVQPKDERVTLARTTYAGVDYCSALRQDNIYGFQFHPERSGRGGLRVYEWLATALKGSR